MNFIDLKPGLSFGGAEIKAYRSEKKSDAYLFLIGGVHGDEVEGVYALEQLFEWLKQNDDLELPLIVCPILNVDGYQAGTRVNGRGVDLNRNLPTEDWNKEFEEAKYHPGEGPLSEAENQFLVKLFKKYPPKLILSFHSWKPILNYNGNCKDIAEFITTFNGYPVEGDIGYPTPGSLGTYAPSALDTPVLTYEFPKISDEKLLKDIWKENEQGLKTLFASDVLKAKLNEKH